ncbi:MAG TPA: class I SAM-dependent methyltransferase, partial [Polyangiaceae bacterium]|nr:class I SAM-dependent methyltransferase [Polyangiaceae bacterium]
PTCGTGTFLAAARRFSGARLVGYERSPVYVEAARQALAGTNATLRIADFFATDWASVVAELPEPLLVLGNPPWVTNSTLGSLDAQNLPAKSNHQRQAGFDALTGKSNFDISEWMLGRLLDVTRGRRFTLAMLCKAAVARRLLERCAGSAWELSGAVHAIDARAHFAATVAAVLLVVRGSGERARAPSEPRWAVYSSLAASEPASHMGVSRGRVFSDFDVCRATSALETESAQGWRSGVKHDLARLMELVEEDGTLRNGLGEAVAIERDHVYPLFKGTDLVRERRSPRRFVLVTQRTLGEDTSAIRERAPATWRYLERHRAAFEARKSRIYRGQPPFSMFGVGEYTFAPNKVAISALHKELTFRALAPEGERPVVLDDTAYFLPCANAERAALLVRALTSPLARRFFEARLFWDAMRPVNKALLESLSLAALEDALAREPNGVEGCRAAP